ncbi:MAG: hypothetical protein V4819_08745 [Verrucomicrobiota bacterium]
MIFRFSTAFAALGCVLLASCYPYDENKNKKPAPPTQTQKTMTPAEQQKLKEQRETMKEKEELANKEVVPKDPATDLPTKPEDGTVTAPTIEKRADYPVASKVPGKEGYVFSPFNNKLIDVKDMPSGTLVSDPTYPESAKKFFRVP